MYVISVITYHPYLVMKSYFNQDLIKLGSIKLATKFTSYDEASVASYDLQLIDSEYDMVASIEKLDNL